MSVPTQGPALYEFTYDETKFTYAPGALGTVPRAVYSGPLGKRSFEGDELRLHESPRGLEVSVTLHSHLQTVTLTVFVPELALDDGLAQSFRTVGIHATQRRRIAGGPGAGMTAQPLELDGLAQLVEQRVGTPALL